MPLATFLRDLSAGLQSPPGWEFGYFSPFFDHGTAAIVVHQLQCLQKIRDLLLAVFSPVHHQDRGYEPDQHRTSLSRPRNVRSSEM